MTTNPDNTQVEEKEEKKVVKKKKSYGKKVIACRLNKKTYIPERIGEKRMLPKFVDIKVTKEEYKYLKEESKSIIGG